MENLILLVHVVIAVAIIGLILLQQGKGAEMGASFGSGASQTLFGASGTGNFFSRSTAWLAAVFFATSFTLAVIAKQASQVEEGIPSVPTLIEDKTPAIEDRAPIIQDDSMTVPALEEALVDPEADYPSLEEVFKNGTPYVPPSIEESTEADPVE